jgi:hypothetical protein
MQKKKPSFQAIPNWGFRSLRNWNESKEAPVDQARNDGGPQISEPAARILAHAVTLKEPLGA